MIASSGRLILIKNLKKLYNNKKLLLVEHIFWTVKSPLEIASAFA